MKIKAIFNDLCGKTCQMRKNIFAWGVLIVFVFTSCQEKNNNMQAPDIEKKPKELTIHDNTRIDNYYWLNDRKNPEVIDYLKAENAYSKAWLKDTEQLQETLFREFTSRIKQEDQSVPYTLNGYEYYSRYEEGAEQPLFCRKADTGKGPEEIILNAESMAKNHAYFDVGSLSVSHNNRFLAYSLDTVSRRKFTIYIKDLKTGEIFEDQISNTTGDITWANDNKTLFYVMKDESLRPYRIYKHILGQHPDKDKLIFEEKDATFVTGIHKSKSQQYIFISSHSTLSDEYRFVRADQPDAPFQIIQSRQRKLEYSVAHHGDVFYILTNLNAKNFRIMKTAVTATTKEHWQEVIAHDAQTLIEDIDLFENFMVINQRTNGLTQIRIKTWDNKHDYLIPFDEAAYTAFSAYQPDYHATKVRYKYTSLTQAPQTVEMAIQTRKKQVLKQVEVLGGYDATQYESKRFFATAKDGTRIPVSMVFKKGWKQNGEAPLLLYGYGSYGYSMDPYFSYSRISLLDRGWAYAIAHVRGGQEMGRDWYENGKLLKKKNTFTDFTDVAAYLIDNNYTSSDKLFAMGGSAGGLLMGAVVNMKPALFKGVVAAVPFVDVVTTMLDESIPLTTGEFDEWGNPKDKTYYDYMLSYSPYDNVEAKDYPAMLVTTGLHDSQVQYWEPAKWVAKLRDLKTDNHPLLLWTNMNFGHSGASGRFQPYKETAMEFAFMLKTLETD